MVQTVTATRNAQLDRQSHDHTQSALAFHQILTNAKISGGQSASSSRLTTVLTPLPADSDQGVSATRKRQIDDWVANHSDSSGGFFSFGETSAVQHVRDALDGKMQELGYLTPDEQRYLMDQVLARWSRGKGAGPGGAAELVQSLGHEPQVASMVAQRLAVKTVALIQQPVGNDSINDPHSQARAYALDALQAVSGAASRTPSNYGPLRQMMESLGPDAAARFVQALNPSAPGSGYFLMSQAQDRILAAMNGGPPTRTTSAVVQTIFAETSPGALHGLPPMQQDMAKALTREWYPDNPVKQVSEAKRLAGIFATVQGQQLLFASGTDGEIPLDARVNALAIIRSDTSINAATLTKTDDPWTNMAIVGPIARANARQYLTLRGDAPQTLQGTDLDNTVGFAMGFPPTVPRGVAPNVAQAKAASAGFSYYAQGPGQQPVQAVVYQIRRLGGANPQVTVLPIEYSSSGSGPVQLPLFRVHTAQGDQYVDNTGRSYTSLQDWKDHNQLPPGLVVFPDQGHLTAGADGTVKLDGADTPATPDTPWKQVKGLLNDAALVGGIIAGGALIVGTDGLATPIVAGIGVVSGAWGTYSTGSDLLDRSQHGQSINPIQDSTARGLWLALAANTAGMGAFASEAALARIASTGGELSATAAWTLGTAKAMSNVTNAAAFSNASIDLVANWGSMTPQQRAQAVLSMGFWGVTLAVGARGARRPGDMFDPAKMTDALLESNQTKISVRESKWDYFYGRVTSSEHNRARSQQNLRDLETLGFPDTPEGHAKLFKLFVDGRRSPETARYVSKYGVTITRTVKVGKAGVIDVKYFYPGDNLSATPEISSIVPKIFKK